MTENTDATTVDAALQQFTDMMAADGYVLMDGRTAMQLLKEAGY